MLAVLILRAALLWKISPLDHKVFPTLVILKHWIPPKSDADFFLKTWNFMGYFTFEVFSEVFYFFLNPPRRAVLLFLNCIATANGKYFSYIESIISVDKIAIAAGKLQWLTEYSCLLLSLCNMIRQKGEN